MSIAAKLLRSVKKLPDSPGVYFFRDIGKRVLYIGKATSLKTRVRSDFPSDLAEKRSEYIAKMIQEATRVEYQLTDSVLEALILEAELIRTYRPPYNILGKDQKSFNFVIITKEDFPRILVMRERTIELGKLDFEIKDSFGPFTQGMQLREALKIIRRIFPYRDDTCVPLSGKPCFNHQIGLCPGVCVGKVSISEYARTIRHIRRFFRGEKTKLVKDLHKEMRAYAKNKEFEKAETTKRQITALTHINDIALIRRDRPDVHAEGHTLQTFRIEAYDVAHTSGKHIVGVMTVVENGEVKKSDYRLFRVKQQSGADDPRALREILLRRLNHQEWRYPDLIVVDGGVAQLNAARSALETRDVEIPVVSVVKDSHHKPREIENAHEIAALLSKKHKNEILLANSESHRFAINYHRKLRDKNFKRDSNITLKRK